MRYGVISAKGGVGATVLALSLARLFAREENTFLGDGDWGRRSLDIYTGHSGVYDFYNLLKGNDKGLMKIEPKLYYASASLSKSLKAIEGEESERCFHGPLKHCKHWIVDFSHSRVEDVEPFYEDIYRLLLVSDDTPVGLKQMEGLYWALRRRRWTISPIILGVKDSKSLEARIHRSLPNFPEYHIVPMRKTSTLFDEEGHLTGGEDHFMELLENIESEQWKNPEVTGSLWERIFQ